MTTHEVKSWAHFFDAIADGRKSYDLRKDDRGYNIGDVLVLCRYDIVEGKYTGEKCCVTVTYITNNQHPCAYSSAVLPHDYCILGYNAGPHTVFFA